MKTILDASNALFAEDSGCTAEQFSPERRYQFPKESIGLEAERSIEVYNLTPGVNDESALLVNDFRPTRNELEVIARHYTEIEESIYFSGELYGYRDFDPKEIFANRRLESVSSDGAIR